jgi:outer membrane immunogenic protein
MRKDKQMKTPIAVVALAAGLLATPALAQGDNDAPGGFYVGALAGYEGLKVDSGDGSVTANADSAVYGINAGYDLSLGSAFVGVEGELSKSGGSTEFPSTFAGARDGLDANGQYYLGARAGVALTPGIAAYGKIGYTALDTKAFTSSGSLSDLKQNADGLRFGAGLQVQLPGPLEARIEYRRSKYKDVNSVDFGDATTNQVVAGIGVRF